MGANLEGRRWTKPGLRPSIAGCQVENSLSVTKERTRTIPKVFTLFDKNYFQDMNSFVKFSQVFVQLHFFCGGPQKAKKWKTGRLIFVSDRLKPFEHQPKFVHIHELIELSQVIFIGCGNFRHEQRLRCCKPAVRSCHEA